MIMDMFTNFDPNVQIFMPFQDSDNYTYKWCVYRYAIEYNTLKFKRYLSKKSVDSNNWSLLYWDIQEKEYLPFEWEENSVSFFSLKQALNIVSCFYKTSLHVEDGEEVYYCGLEKVY